MIISFSKSYVFVHIPKTGGTSLTSALEAKVGKDDILIGDTPKAVKRRHRLKALAPAGRLWKHSKLRDVAGVVSPEQMEAFCVFAITRNPWDRFVSYYHWLQAQRFSHRAVELAQQLSFAEFLRHPVNLSAIHADQTKDYLSDEAGGYRGNFVLRLEHLSDDADELERLLGFKLGSIPHQNASQRRADYREYYSDDGAEIIAAAYRDDIQKFGYVF